MSFTPTRVTITAITNANPAVVTSSSNHNLTTGQVIRLNIPTAYGMQELNNKIVQITSLSNTTFSLQFSQVPPGINVDSRSFSSFTNASVGTPAAFVPIGSMSSPVLNLTWQIRSNYCESSINDAYLNNSTVEIPF